ncbi:hypothetical protein OVS_04400 [Mycoplasma ovis str. Michigan]|uniref:Uncharacterized protein n=1 Tax=Mycoplasma ovis str. Michigan TaxID=1415773 RepID=A0ABM5P297_9MOLU|nr:hypothetical protein [Mycoplasma ovis]AHC40607.1 hypothetical protein OVS_04400 [Mycoplasma ovis str. Michigan]
MSVSAKALTLFAGVGGGCGGIPWLLSNWNSFRSENSQVAPQSIVAESPSIPEHGKTEDLGERRESATTESTKPELETPPTPTAPKQLKEEKGNCEIVSYKEKDHLENLETMLF